MVVWSHKFHPDLPERYDSITSSSEFLQVYSTLMRRGTKNVMANYFHITLKNSWSQSWFMNPPLGSGRSWSGLCHTFLANFQGTSNHPVPQIDLDWVI
jgi:hypothetical protein